jgi:hypothetical protein
MQFGSYTKVTNGYLRELPVLCCMRKEFPLHAAEER